MLKGGDFEKRLVARTADGLAMSPLATRADAGSAATAIAKKPSYFQGGWDIRQRHAEPDPELANAAILEDLQGGVTSLLLQIMAPGQSGLSYSAEALSTALKGVFLNGCTIALDARENTMDAAGSLIELWRAANLSENARLGAFNCDPLGVLAATGTLYYPADRACEIAAKLAVDCRAMSHVTALLADGRPYHEAGASEAQELAAMLATLVAYLRACEAQGLRPRMALGKIALCLAADTDLFLTVAKLRAARVLVARVAEPAGRERRRRHAPDRHHQRAHAGAARSLGEHAARHRGVRGRGVRRRRCDHRAAFHVGAGQARPLRPAHRPQYAPGAAGGERARPRGRSGRRRLGGREADAGSGRQGLGAVPGHRGQGGMARVLESGFWQGEIANVAEARGRELRPAGWN